MDLWASTGLVSGVTSNTLDIFVLHRVRGPDGDVAGEDPELQLGPSCSFAVGVDLV